MNRVFRHDWRRTRTRCHHHQSHGPKPLQLRREFRHGWNGPPAGASTSPGEPHVRGPPGPSTDGRGAERATKGGWAAAGQRGQRGGDFDGLRGARAALPVARGSEEAHSRRNDEDQQRAEDAHHQGDQETWPVYVLVVAFLWFKQRSHHFKVYVL